MNIGPPPEFGRDGSPPPAVSAPIEIARWNLDSTVSRVLGIQDWPPKRRVIDKAKFFGLAILPMGQIWAGTYDIVKSVKENDAFSRKQEEAIKSLFQKQGALDLDWSEVAGWQVQAVYDYFWRREDPVTQLPPGGSTELSLSLQVGISEERANEVTRSLGITGAHSQHLGLSAQLSDKSSTKVALSQQREISRKITLTNPSNNMYRRLALWHVVHRLSIVTIPESALDKEFVCQRTEFVLSDVTNVTSMDVAHS